MNSKGARILWDLTVCKRKCIVQLCNLFPVPGLYSNFLFIEIFSRMSAIYHSHTNVSQTCKLVRFRHYYRFFQSWWSTCTLLYNVFARGCIYHVYPIACFCMYIYLTCILIKDEVIEPTVHQVPLLWSIFFFERDFFWILKILEYYRNLFKEI